jgi:hypothetical protein
LGRLGRILSGVVFGGVVGAQLCACGDTSTPTVASPACCLNDPLPHGVTLLDCTDDADCTAGTACLDATDLDPSWPRANDPFKTLQSCRGTLGKKVCGIPSTRSGMRQALTQGFHAPAFQLTEVTTDTGAEPTAYTWQAPAGTRIVSCALFACRPAVRATATQEGRRVNDIVNFDDCAVATEVFEPGSGVFDLKNPDLEYHPTEVAEPKCQTLPGRRVSELQVGCWAYDTTDIIAATPLVPVKAQQEVWNYQGLFGDCSVATNAGKACSVAGTDRIGSCYENGCSDVCVDNHDCDAPDLVSPSSDGGTAPSRTADASAPRDAGHPTVPAPKPPVPFLCLKQTKFDYVGVCIRAGGP